MEFNNDLSMYSI